MTQKPTAAYRARIEESYPGLRIESISLIDTGQNNDVVMVNGETIFRFPRYSGGIDQLEAETGLLRALQGRLSLAVPDPLYTAFHPREVGSVFMGYPSLPGRPIRGEDAAGLAGDALQRLAEGLAAFLRSLHDVPVDLPLPGGRPTHPLALWEDLYGRMVERLFPRMTEGARSWTVRHFETFLSDPRNAAINPTVVHGDFGPTNILWNPETGLPTGVIDWSSAHLGDPAVDLAAVSTLAPGFLPRLLTTYPEAGDVLDRVRFYKGTFALQEALFGVENGDDEALRAGMADIPPPAEMLSL